MKSAQILLSRPSPFFSLLCLIYYPTRTQMPRLLCLGLCDLSPPELPHGTQCHPDVQCTSPATGPEMSFKGQCRTLNAQFGTNGRNQGRAYWETSGHWAGEEDPLWDNGTCIFPPLFSLVSHEVEELCSITHTLPRCCASPQPQKDKKPTDGSLGDLQMPTDRSLGDLRRHEP